MEGLVAGLKDAVGDAVHTLVGDNNATEHSGIW